MNSACFLAEIPQPKAQATNPDTRDRDGQKTELELESSGLLGELGMGAAEAKD